MQHLCNSGRMKNAKSRKSVETEGWPRKVTFGRIAVSVYRRKTPQGNVGYMVANYATGKRRFDAYPTEDEALDAALTLAQKLSENQVLAAELTNKDAAAYVAACQAVAPHDLLTVAHAVQSCLKLVGDLPGLLAACKIFAARHKTVTPKRVQEVVEEVLSLKANRLMSKRYVQDLRWRLHAFGKAFQKNIGDVTPQEIQAWFDAQKFGLQSYMNFKRVVHLLCEHAVARGYADINPAKGVQRVKVVPTRDIEIFSPEEIDKLLAAASPDFLPALAIGAFAGLRSAEILRLEWSDVDLKTGFITVGRSKAKTASRRVVPILDNLMTWLRPYSSRQGQVWAGGFDEFYKTQLETAKAAGVPWKPNGLRHSYATYRYAIVGNAGRVAGEMGNSASVVHKHYRQLATPGVAHNSGLP